MRRVDPATLAAELSYRAERAHMVSQTIRLRRHPRRVFLERYAQHRSRQVERWLALAEPEPEARACPPESGTPPDA